MKIILLFLSLTLAACAAAAQTLAWTVNPADNVTSCKVYEHVGTAYNLIATVIAPLTTYSLAGVPAGAHIYAVTAVNIRGESLRSAEITFPATPAAPTGLQIIP
jgi:hypothetical protein